MKHHTHDFVSPKNIAVLPPVFCSYLHHIDTSTKPEQREESVERRFGDAGILSIKSRKLSSKHKIAKLPPSLISRRWIVFL